MDVVRHVAVSSIAAAMLALSPGISTADRMTYCGTARWQSIIAQAATRFELPERWLHAVIRAESGGCETIDGAPTVSSAGAMGLMQLMPDTWAEYRDKLQLRDDPHEPLDNILAGSAYLRDLYDRFGWPGALAAYHAGPARYDEHLSDGRSLPQSTLDYLAHVERLTGDHEPLGAVDRTLFITRSASIPSSDGPADDKRHDGLFVALRHGDRRGETPAQGSADVQK